QRDDQHGGHARLLPDARRGETVRRDQPRAIGTVAAMSEVVEPSVPSDVEAIVKAVDGQYQEWLATLGELVRIPSVSGDPAHAVDVERSADAVAAALEVAGLDHVRAREAGACRPHRLRAGVHRGDAQPRLR